MANAEHEDVGSEVTKAQAVLADRLARFKEWDVVGALRNAASVIPDARYEITSGVTFAHGFGSFNPMGPEGKLIGRWYIDREKENDRGSLNKRGVATLAYRGHLFDKEEDLAVGVAIERYRDKVQGDEIVDAPRTTDGAAWNSVLFDSSEENSVLGELMYYCEADGLIPPADMPEVVKRMKEHPEIFSTLLADWEEWGVWPKKSSE